MLVFGSGLFLDGRILILIRVNSNWDPDPQPWLGHTNESVGGKGQLLSIEFFVLQINSFHLLNFINIALLRNHLIFDKIKQQFDKKIKKGKYNIKIKYISVNVLFMI